MDNIILIGMPGSGKSTVGVVLAKALGLGFVDVDLLIQEREGALLQELIDSRGVERFLDLERDAVCSLRCRGTVVAPGGSCVCREGHRPLPRPDPGRRVPIPGAAVWAVRPHHRPHQGPEPGGDGGSSEESSGAV